MTVVYNDWLPINSLADSIKVGPSVNKQEAPLPQRAQRIRRA